MVTSRTTLQREVSAKKSKLSDKDIFTSDAFRRTCENILRGVGKIFNIKSFHLDIVWGNPKTDPVAYTNAACQFYLNANNVIVSGKKVTRLMRYEALLGILCHETAHRLWTDFKEANIIHSNIMYGATKFASTRELDRYLKVHPEQRPVVASIHHTIANSIEDGYIEKKFMQKFRGYKKYLITARTLHRNMPMLDSSEMKSEGADTISVVINHLLNYAKFDIYPNDDDNDVMEAFENIVEDVDNALTVTNGKERQRKYLHVTQTLILWLEEQEKKKQNNDQDNQDGSDSQNSDGGDGGQNGQGNQSQNDSGSSENNQNDKEENGDDEPEQSDKDEGNNSNNESSDTSGENEENDPSNDSGKSQQNASGDDSGQGSSDIGEILKEIAKAMQGQEHEQESNAHNFSPIEANADADSNSNGTDSAAQTQESNEVGSADALSRVENDTASEQVAADHEAEIRDALDTLKENMDFGDYHKRTHSDIQRVGKIEASQDYDQIIANAKTILRRMIREWQKQIKDLQLGDNLNGLYSGRRVSQPHRTDLKRFSKRKAPQDIPNMSLVLLIDLSGSMYGVRSEAARKTAILIALFCKEMGIRFACYGHRVNAYNHVQMFSFAEFDSIDNNDMQRISNITKYVGGCNRDGYAVRFCAEKLSKETTDQRLLMILSDGAPNDDGYGFKWIEKKPDNYTFEMSGNAKCDIADILRIYRKKGIGFITAGLGEDSMVIKDLYTYGLSDKIAARYLDISDYDRMPKTFIEILKKEIMP